VTQSYRDYSFRECQPVAGIAGGLLWLFTSMPLFVVFGIVTIFIVLLLNGRKRAINVHAAANGC
jgi:hypothetical protein